MNLFRKELVWPQIEIQTIRKRSQVLVIDDNDFAYRKLLENDEFNVTKWNDIEDLNRLDDGYYDLILLDINGIGREISSEQGFGVLKHLKKNNPTQLIIAYSNSDWSLKYQEFFELADARLAKTDDYTKFKSTIENLLKYKFSRELYEKKILEVVSGADSDKNIIKNFHKALTTGNSDYLNKYFTRIGLDYEKIKKGMKILEVCLGIYKIIKVVA